MRVADGSGSLRSALRKLQVHGESADFTISGQERVFPVHLFVLAGRCTRFTDPALARRDDRTLRVFEELELGDLTGNADEALAYVIEFLYSDATPDVNTDPDTLLLFGKICRAWGGPPFATRGGQIVPASRSNFSLEPALSLPEAAADLVIAFSGPGAEQRQWFLSSVLCSCQSTFIRGFLAYERAREERNGPRLSHGADEDIEAKAEAEVEVEPLGSRHSLIIHPSDVLPSPSTLDLIIKFLHTGKIPLKHPKREGAGDTGEDAEDDDERGLRPEHALELARYFGIPHLFVAVESVLMEFVNAETVVDLWVLVDNFYQPGASDQNTFLGGDLLFDTCLDCFCSNWAEVTRSEAFLSMPKRLLLEALTCGNIDESRESMMEALTLWADHQQASEPSRYSSAASPEATIDCTITTPNSSSDAGPTAVEVGGLRRILIDMVPPVTLFNARNKRHLTQRRPVAFSGLAGLVPAGLA